MRPAETGFLLLTSPLGDPERRVLTQAQLRVLTQRVRSRQQTREGELEERDLLAMGYDRTMARRIVQLLSDTDQLQWYLRRAARAGCVPVSRISQGYPQVLLRCFGPEAPGCLWAKGDLSLLEKPAIALVGSRELRPDNAAFAVQVGKQAALQGYVLISGNARGADRTAQDACLAAGGQVVSIVADSLEERREEKDVLWLSEDGFDLPFTNQRALSRNRLIHSMGQLTLVAQSDLERGGTWDGTVKNLRGGWSPVYCFDDGIGASAELIQRGASPITLRELARLKELKSDDTGFY